jgi:hypothetical protein
MKFSVGDPVYIKSNQEEGVIVEIVDKNTAKVRAGKAVYHVFFEDLDHPYLNWFLNKNKEKKQGKIFVENILKEKGGRRETDLVPGVYLVCFPQYQTDDFDEVIDKIKLYFYNETERDYLFSYSAKSKKETWFEHDNEIFANSSFYIHDLSFEIMASTPVFNYKFADKKDSALETESFLALKPKKLFEYLDKIKYENKAFFSIPLFEKLEAKPIVEIDPADIALKAPSADKQSHFDFSHVLKKSKYEIDLHIEKLVSRPEKLTSAEKLDIQLNEFVKALDLASVTHQRSVVFIHGVGKGTLKAEIHKILLLKKQTKAIRAYVNNYDTRYGYGATEVFF